MPSLDAFDASEAGDVEYIKGYLSAGNNPDAADFRGFSLLHLAIEHFHPEIVKLLLAAGANPNLVDRKGVTPITHAIGAVREDANDRDVEPSLELIEVLLRHGADLYLPGPNGSTGIKAAKHWGHPLLRQLLKNYLRTPAESKTESELPNRMDGQGNRTPPGDAQKRND